MLSSLTIQTLLATPTTGPRLGRLILLHREVEGVDIDRAVHDELDAERLRDRPDAAPALPTAPNDLRIELVAAELHAVGVGKPG